MRTLGPLFTLFFLATASAAAQWRIGLELGVTRYGGSATDTSNAHVASSGRPGDGTTIGIRLGRQGRQLGLGLRASYAKPGFTVAGKGITVTDRTSGDLFELSAFVSTRVGGIGPSGAGRVELGPALHLWNFGEMRSRLGALGALAYEWPIAGRLWGAVRLEGTVSKSWFDASDVPPEFERRVTWRYGAGLGVSYRL